MRLENRGVLAYARVNSVRQFYDRCLILERDNNQFIKSIDADFLRFQCFRAAPLCLPYKAGRAERRTYCILAY